jgi:hypothetical protein
VVRSTDGMTWQNISTGVFNGRVSALTHVGNTVFAGLGQDQQAGDTTQRGLWKYDGTTWSQVGGIPTTQLIVDVKASGNVLLAAGAGAQGITPNGGVFRSSDAGATWTDVTANGLRTDAGWFRTVAFDPSNPTIVYVAHGRPAGSAEIYRSSDQGLSWSLIYSGLVDEVPSAMLVDGLLTGFQTGLYAFGEQKVKITPSFDSKKQKLQCVVKVGKQAVTQRPVVAMTRAPKARVFKKLKTANTNAKGTVSFALKKLKKGTKLYCTAVGQKSATKTL